MCNFLVWGMIQNEGVNTPLVGKIQGLLYPQRLTGNSFTDHNGGLMAASEWEEINYPYQGFLKGKLQP